MARKNDNEVGILQTLIVHDNESGAILGTGWVTWCSHGVTSVTLVDFQGKQLPEAWYKLEVVDDKRLVVLSGRIH